MKRHPALVPLSREHYGVLYLAVRLQRATTNSAEQIARELREQWPAEEGHLRREEQILLPAYAADPQAVGSDIAQVLDDHELIRQIVAEIADCPSLGALRALGVKLADHVHYEERVVFPQIQKTLPQADLYALGARLRQDQDADRTRRPAFPRATA